MRAHPILMQGPLTCDQCDKPMKPEDKRECEVCCEVLCSSCMCDFALCYDCEASDKADPSAQARINKQLTNAQAFQILGGGVLRDPVGYLISRNILKQCGIPLKQMKLTAPTEAQKEQR